MKPEPTFQLPAAMTGHALEIDRLYLLLYWMSVVILAGIVGTALYFVLKYRRKKGVLAAQTVEMPKLEFAWTVLPCFVLAFLFHRNIESYVKLAIAPPQALEIRVRGYQWGWDFEYPNGAHSSALHIPVHRAVKLILSSSDVIHSFFVPQFRVKKDLVPGMYTSLWFEANAVGDADLFCAEYCGGKGEGAAASGHWSMISKVHVQSQEEFDQFLAAGLGAREGESVAQWGERLMGEKNCKQCHSVDGTSGIGPSWKGIWGEKQEFTDGTSEVVDENYIRRSILEPQAQIVRGYAPVMPTYKGVLQDKEIDALIAYIKTLEHK